VTPAIQVEDTGGGGGTGTGIGIEEGGAKRGLGSQARIWRCSWHRKAG